MRDLVDELLHAKVNAKLFGGDQSPKLGRLVIRERIGAGAMGTVFEGFDPRLERKVAIKVLRDDTDAQRVLAEARALAKLQHPNVVGIYDADALDGLVYIVMEYVTGPSLRAWLAGGHAWPVVVRVMREAAEGVAAAHAAGLVHRDIKPDNILIGDDRARVVDFGLAHVQVADEGSSAGTPFYMAPEVLAGGAATAASDQFSFGVTLFEALYGKRPHAALPTGVAATEPAGSATVSSRSSRDQLLEELRTAATTAAAAPRPPGSDVPAWLHAIVQRALAADPAARFPSMAELAGALRPPSQRRSRTLAFAAIGLVVLGGVVGVAAYRHHGAGDPCTGGPARIATAWSPDTRARLEKSLAGTPWLSQTLAALDGKAIDWTTSYRHVCQASKRGEQSDTLLDLRMRCLDRELDRLAALTAELDSAKLEIAARVAAPSAVAEIDVAGCERLTDPGDLAIPADPAERTKARDQQRALDHAQALFSLGRYTQSRDALPAADAVTLPRLRAERLALAAAIEARIGNGDAASKLLDDALLAAADAKAPRLELDIWSRRLRNELFAGSPAKVLEWEPFARAAAKHAGLDGADLDGILGQALRNAGQLSRAKQVLEQGLASADPLRPEQRALLEMNVGSIELETGHSDAALKTLTEARDTVLGQFGDKHPDLAIYDDKLAAAFRVQGKLRKAMELHERSLAIRTAAFGPDDRSVATSLLYRAQTELEAGDVLAADADLTKAKAIREKVYGAKSPRLGEVYMAMADVSAERGAPEVAAQQRTTALALDPRLAPVDDPLLSVDRANAIARALDTDKQSATVRVSQLRAALPADADLALIVPVGEALVAGGDLAGAKALLEPAAKRLSDEPTRTGLHLMIAYAKASKDPQVARTAVALYQALPKLDRTDYDAIWALSTKAEAP